jgi:hypothetical protein
MSEPPVKLSSCTHQDSSRSYWLLWRDQYWHASEFEYRLIAKGATPTELGMNPFEDEEQD